MDINGLLLSYPAITAIVGNRVYPLLLPKSTLDSGLAITWQIVSTTNQQMMFKSGMVRQRIQINCWSQDYPSAYALRQEVEESLNGFSGSVGSLYCQRIDVLGPIDYFEDTSEYFRLATEIHVYYQP